MGRAGGVAVVWCAVALCLGLGGCATSRYDELRARSREVKTELERERDAALAAGATAGSGARLDHLSSLRLSLTAVNVGLSAARYGMEESRRPIAYDAIEEAYDTIEWNIPLGPGDELRPMPAAFRGGRFDESRLTPAVP